MKRATAQNVAMEAGVSKWTVIRAFTPGASITEASKAKVLEAAERLNYRPNLLARSLATNSTHQVAVLVDDFANPHKLPFLEKLTASLQAEGLVTILININQHYSHVHAILNADQRQVDAIVLFGTAFRDEMLTDHKLGRGGPPMFVLARDSQIEGVPAISCDAVVAIAEIGKHLLERGYRRPGFMAGARTLSTALGRRRNFKEFWRTTIGRRTRRDVCRPLQRRSRRAGRPGLSVQSCAGRPDRCPHVRKRCPRVRSDGCCPKRVRVTRAGRSRHCGLRQRCPCGVTSIRPDNL